MSTWHATSVDLASYRSGAANAVVVASLETHLLRCEECQRALAALRLPDAGADSERRWRLVSSAIDSRLDDRHRTLFWRLGVSTRPLAAALLMSMTLVLVVPLLASLTDERGFSTALLLCAPLVPMVAVAFAYRRETDPAGELSLALPMAGIRLVTRRALLVTTLAVPAGVLGALALDVPLGTAFAWLLPGLAMAALVLLAGTTRFDPAVVAVVLGSAWAFAVSGAAHRGGAALVTDLVVGVPVQTTSLLVAAAAMALVVLRRDRVAYRSRL